METTEDRARAAIAMLREGLREFDFQRVAKASSELVRTNVLDSKSWHRTLKDRGLSPARFPRRGGMGTTPRARLNRPTLKGKCFTSEVYDKLFHLPSLGVKHFPFNVGLFRPALGLVRLNEREALVWDWRNQTAPIAMQPQRGKKLSPRHSRKYAEAELPEDRSFYFRGPDQKLNLRAQNLKLFVQIATGIDDATWLHHLRHQDYSRWIREALKDESLANEVDKIERECRDPDANSRALIFSAIERRYTASS